MILEAIYNGDFYPSETVVPKSEKYRNALRACVWTSWPRG